MKFRTLLIPASFLLVIGMISIANPHAAYSATTTSCLADLDGSEEVPAVDTEGNGTATMEFDPSNNELTWSIEFSELSGSATAAHFHGPASIGTNAGVQVNIGEVSGLNSPMNGSAVLTAEQASMLLDDELYINIHTAANSNGEIRGQVTCESAPVEGPTKTATVTIGDQEFEIQYTISGGSLEGLTADSGIQTLMASISSTSDGVLTLWLPTEVIDSEEDFSVFIDDEFGNFVVDELTPTADSRVLRIEFPMGAEDIEVVGTSIVPEFGSLVLIVASISIVGVILATKRVHGFRGLQA